MEYQKLEFTQTIYGGEFNSQVFRDMAKNLNMTVKNTAGYSPWSNGIVERHNATLNRNCQQN